MPREIDIGADILGTTRDEETKTVLAQTGDVVSQSVEADNVEMWQHVGFVSRPPKADPKKAACQAIVVRDTGYDACIATRDLRGQELAGSLKEGETCVYAAGSDGKAQARSLWKADGSISHVTFEGNASSGATFGFFLQPSGNMDMVAKDAALLLRPSDISLFSPTASVALKGGDAKIYASGTANINAASIVLGGPSAQPTLNASDLTAILTAVSAMIGTSAAPSAGLVAATIPTQVAAIMATLAQRKTRNE